MSYVLIKLGIVEDRDKQNFGERLRRLREERHLSRAQLALRAGIDANYIYKLETGRQQRPSRPFLEALAVGLGVSTAELIGEAEAAVLDPELEGIQVNLKTLKELDADSIKVVQRIVDSMLHEAQELYRERQRAKRKHSNAQQDGQVDNEIPPP